MTTEQPLAVDNILGLIGETPLVRLRFVAGSERTHAAVFGKCEMMNPGGSVKDRIALSMIEAGERAGTLVTSTVLPGTSEPARWSRARRCWWSRPRATRASGWPWWPRSRATGWC